MTMTFTSLFLLDIPQNESRRLEDTGNILAVCDRRHVLAENDVGDRLIESGLEAPAELVALRTRRSDELEAHLLELLVADPAEPVLAVARRSRPGIGQRIADDDAAPPGRK